MVDAIRSVAGQQLAAIPFDNLIFIALIVVAVFLRWISQQAGKAKKKSEEQGAPRSTPLPARAPAETDEERVRRFLEALGQPTSAKPPPKVTARPIQKRTVAPRTRPVLSPLPPLTTAPADLPPEPPPEAEAQISEPVERQIVKPELIPSPVFEMRDAGASQAAPAPEKIAPLVSDVVLFPETAPTSTAYPELSVLLKSQRGLRDAIILREVFGPPRSLQALDELRSF